MMDDKQLEEAERSIVNAEGVINLVETTDHDPTIGDLMVAFAGIIAGRALLDEVKRLRAEIEHKERFSKLIDAFLTVKHD